GTCAVIHPDSGEAKNTTALATSSGSPMRSIIARAAKLASVPGQSAAPRPRCVISVRTKPGATAFTVMPCCPSSRAKRRVRLTTSACVECIARQRGADRRDRGQIDNPPVAPRPHAPHHCARGMDHAVHVYLAHARDLLPVVGVQCALPSHAGVVHQDGHRTQFCFG